MDAFDKYKVEFKQPIISGVWKERIAILLYNLAGMIVLYLFLKYL